MEVQSIVEAMMEFGDDVFREVFLVTVWNVDGNGRLGSDELKIRRAEDNLFLLSLW